MPKQHIALIPARGNSKGIPRKNLQDLGGKPLLAWTIEAALASDVFHTVYVSTEDAEVATVAQHYGATVLDRPPLLSMDHVQLDEVTLYSLRQLQMMGMQPDTLTLIQATTPFVSSEHLREAHEMFIFGPLDCGTVFTAARDPKYHWVPGDHNAEEIHLYRASPIHHNPNRRVGRQWTDPKENLFWENGAVYVVPVERLSLERTFRVQPMILCEMSEEDSLEIDTPFDLFRARQYLAWKAQENQ